MEELNANTGESTPSPTVDGATSAGSEGVAQVEQTQGQTAPPATEEFSAGWSFEDEAQPEPVEPEEEDFSALLADPNLDQAQAPKLVQDLRGARAEAKQQKAEIKRLNGEIERLNQTGYGLANDLIYKPQEAAVPFLRELAGRALPAYQALFDTFVQYESDNLVAALQAAGKLPDAAPQQASPAQLTAEDWQRIPEDLREIAKQVPAEQMINWLDKGTDESLLFNLQSRRDLLETQKELGELKGAQKEQAEKEWRSARQKAESDGIDSVNNLSSQFEKAHYAQLNKWQPFGPGETQQNQFLYKACLEGAHAMLGADNQYREMYEQVVKNLRNAPLRRLQNDHLGADADERDAKALAFRYNSRLGQVMKGFIQSIDSVFRDARAYRESQRKDIPSRTEFSGQSTQTGKNGAPRTLLPNGKTNPAYLEHVIASVSQNTGR